MKLIQFILVSFILINYSANVECRIYEIWNSDVIKEMFENNTQIFSEFIQTKTSEVGNAFTNYVDEAQKKTESLKNEISGFFETKTNEINNSMMEYFGRAINVSNDFMNNVNVFKKDVKCNYDPDVYLNTVQIIARHGYPAETHTVKTEDGYLLSLHRIPRSINANFSKRQPVLLHHGLLASSADWIVPGPEKGLAYILADAGYDVWLANVRGNTYSRAHVNISNEDAAFWDFSWHEVAYYDLPAYVDYINKVTETEGELLYIGHSMGTSVLFAFLSIRPEYNQKLKAAFTLAPVVYMTNIQSPIKVLAPYANDFELIAKFLGNGEFLPQSLVLKWLARFGCEINHFEEKICENSLFILCGYDEKQFNKSLIPIILSHTPAGASTKTLVHFAQLIQSKGKFLMYDYGDEKNMEKYGSKYPPEYPIEKITLPIAMFSANNDWLSATVDAKRLYKQLKNTIDFYEVPLDEFNHLDFLWGIDAPILVYEKLMELMEKYNSQVNSLSWSYNLNKFQISW